MAIVNVPKTDNFSQWRLKTNLIATQQGDLVLLTTPVTTDIVAAINSLVGLFNDDLRRILIRSIGMA